MKLSQAKKHVIRQLLVAATIMSIAILFLIGAGLKSIYYTASHDTSPLSALTYSLQLLIHTAYQSTQFVDWFWQYSPIIRIDNINTPGNWAFLLIIIFGAIGRVIWDSAIKLSRRIAKTILKVEETAWERELTKPQGQVQTTRTDILNINIELLQEDKWYSRPIGVILLSVAATVFAQWCNLIFGLAKL